jgi:hypothetical protein
MEVVLGPPALGREIDLRPNGNHCDRTRLNQVNSPPAIAHSMAWGVPRFRATRRASSAIRTTVGSSTEFSEQATCSAVLPLTIHSSAVVSPETRRAPATHCGHDCVFIAGAGIGRECDPGRLGAYHRLDQHRHFCPRCLGAPEARVRRHTRSMPRHGSAARLQRQRPNRIDRGSFRISRQKRHPPDLRQPRTIARPHRRNVITCDITI